MNQPEQNLNVTSPRIRRALLFGILAVASWSFSTVLEKDIVMRIPALSLIGFQLSISVVLVWLALLWRRQPLPKLAVLFRLGLPGLMQLGLANLFFLLALLLTKASVFSVTVSSETIMTLLLARVLLGERAGRAVLLLGGLATLGVVLVSLGEPDGKQSGSWLGFCLALLGTLFASLHGIASRHDASVHDGDPLLLSALHHSFGLLLVGVIWLIASGLGHGASQANIPFEVWILAAIAAIFQYTLPFWLFLMALRFLSASIGSVLLSLEPVLVISAAAIFLGEKLAIIQWLGATLVLLTMMEMARRTQ